MIVKKPFTGSDRIEALGYDIISLISRGEKESVEDVIMHLGNKNIVHYLIDTYKDKMFFINNNFLYDLNDWEEMFYQHDISFNHDVSRKMGIRNEETDGLLVLLNLIIQEIVDRTYEINWIIIV